MQLKKVSISNLVDRETLEKKTSESAGAQCALVDPHEFDAVLFDMDGIVTKTAIIHASAWKETFDAFLASRTGAAFIPFDAEAEYLRYVDGKPRYDGVRSFLVSRGVNLPPGKPDDKPGFQSICAVGNLKNQKFLQHIDEAGVEAYQTTAAFIQAIKAAGMKTAVVTASRNGVAILKAANMWHVFDVKVDGVDADDRNLKGKPAPDTFLEAARCLGVKPQRAVLVEDSLAGVASGRQGKFGLVIGVARQGEFQDLKQHGADLVVSDLADVRIVGQAHTGMPGQALAELDVSERNWILTYNEYLPALEGRREALCALGNGYFTTRAAAPESSADNIHYPGTYLPGVYNRLKTLHTGFTLEHEEVVNVPNWLPLSFRIEDGPWFNLSDVEILNYQQMLDIRRGVLNREIEFRDNQGRHTTLSQSRFVHMRRCHMAGLETRIVAHNWSGVLTVASAIDGRIVNNGARRYRHLSGRHLQPEESTAGNGMLYLKMQTVQSHIVIAEAARTRISINGQIADVEYKGIIEPECAAQETSIPVNCGDLVCIEKIAAIFTSRDRGISEPGLAAQEAVRDAPSFSTLLEEQRQTWRHLWCQFDIALDTTEEYARSWPSLVLHLHCFHALQCASPNTSDLDTGVPARGWTGEGYQGHIFWDELFIFPFLNYRMPQITRSLLMYRYRRLEQARALSRAKGAAGACYPWRSGSSGREETPRFYFDEKKSWRPDDTFLQVHVNAAIAYNIWQYYQVTADLSFIYACGAEMLLEIARFFASYATYNRRRNRYEIRGVVGPDEYHVAYDGSNNPGINNNAYTNVMAVWTLWRALELLQIVPADHRVEICQRLNILPQELAIWDKVSRGMFVPLKKNGIISQFEGYENLEEFSRQADGKPDAEQLKITLDEQGQQLNQYKMSKQADVLMLFYLFSAEELSELFSRLGYNFSDKDIVRNIEYYMPRTANNSTLSRVAHAWVLSRIDRKQSWKLTTPGIKHKFRRPEKSQIPGSWDVFLEALTSDVLDIQGGTTPEGIHMGAMAGTIDIMQRCYTGLAARNDVLYLNPRLPDSLLRLSIVVHYRDQSILVEITRDSLRITARHSTAKPVKIAVKEKIYKLNAGDSKLFRRLKDDYVLQ